MTKKIFIWVAHPNPTSLCASLADNYQAAAQTTGAEIRRMNLSEMTFNTDTFEGYTGDQTALAPDLKTWQDNMIWADHILLVHPYWWASMPSKAKAVLDQALLPGFGFKYHEKGMGWDKLLKGRTGDAIITSDTPPWLDSLLYRKPGRRVIKNQIFDFVGIKAKTIVQFGSVKLNGKKRISSWLKRASDMGTIAAK